MKKLIIVLRFLFASEMGFSQFNGVYNYKQYQEYLYFDYGKHHWYTSSNLYGIPGWGLSSFYWGVTRSTNRDKNGDYEFKVWLQSNSYMIDYYGNSYWRYTNVSNFKVFIGGEKVSYSYDGFNFRELFCANILTFYNSNPNPYISIKCYHKML